MFHIHTVNRTYIAATLPAINYIRCHTVHCVRIGLMMRMCVILQS